MRKISFLILIISLAGAGTLLNPKAVKAEGCNGTAPSVPTKVSAVSGPSGGEVTIFWDASSFANRYALAYGTVSNKYIYGANNIGGEQSRVYTVKSLQPGVKYYFRLAAAKDCASSPFTSEISAVAGGGKAAVAQPSVPIVSKPVTQVGSPSQPVVSSGPIGKTKLSATSGPRVGEVTLTWQNVDNAQDYHLVYGHSAGKYQYGALNIGRVNKFIVGKLTPGAVYYFAIIPILGQPLYTTDPVMGVASAPVEVVQTTPENLIQPTAPGIVTQPESSASPTVVLPTEAVSLPSSTPEVETPTPAAGL